MSKHRRQSSHFKRSAENRYCVFVCVWRFVLDGSPPAFDGNSSVFVWNAAALKFDTKESTQALNPPCSPRYGGQYLEREMYTTDLVHETIYSAF